VDLAAAGAEPPMTRLSKTSGKVLMNFSEVLVVDLIKQRRAGRERISLAILRYRLWRLYKDARSKSMSRGYQYVPLAMGQNVDLVHPQLSVTLVEVAVRYSTNRAS
jgi:hypothetical protein